MLTETFNVSSDQGKLIRMADLKHCSEAHVANDQQTVGCRVMQIKNWVTLAIVSIGDLSERWLQGNLLNLESRF